MRTYDKLIATISARRSVDRVRPGSATFDASPAAPGPGAGTPTTSTRARRRVDVERPS
jgi:hypothetical protein